jgi:hypothetical protein
MVWSSAMSIRIEAAGWAKCPHRRTGDITTATLLRLASKPVRAARESRHEVAVDRRHLGMAGESGGMEAIITATGPGLATAHTK